MVSASAPHPEAQVALDRLLPDIVAAAGDNLLGVALYGGLAKGRFTPGISDINLLIVVREAGLAMLQALAQPLTAARRAKRVASWVVTPEDLRTAARLFPVKVHDIKAAHRVLHGTVGLEHVVVEPSALRLRALQEVWNVAFRLRRRATEHGMDPPVLWGGITTGLPKLTVTLETVLRLKGAPVPSDRAGVLRSAGQVLGVTADRMDRLAALHRHEPRPDDETVARLFADYLALLREIAASVEGAIV